MKNKDYTGAIFLIFLGTIFLLNTTGVLSWSVWLHILNYWPVFLILGGLRLILGKSLVSTIVISALSLLIFVWVGISAYVNTRDVNNRVFRGFPVVNFNTESVESINKEFTVDTQDYNDIENLDYKFNFGVSKFTISDTSEEYIYIDAKYNDQYGEPQISEEVKNKTLNISTTEKRSTGFGFMNFQTPEYDIQLSSVLPRNLSIDNGVGNGTVSLTEQTVNNLNIKTGTGEVDIELGYDSIPENEIKLDIGTGNIKLTLPSNVGYVITYNLGVGEISLGDTEISGIGHDANEVKSENYDTAEKILNITANVGVGQLDINFN
jgi:predicted membrane protein